MAEETRCGPHIAVVGGGPAGLMAAEVAARGGASVTLYERMPQVGRKFLLAGRGGLNITHSEAQDVFMRRYGPADDALRPLIEAWSPARLREWCADLGQPTVVGSSGRVFPAAFKTSPLLRAWLRRLDGYGVRLCLRHRWLGWDGEGAAVFDTPQGRSTVRADATILALGGASWPQLGSDGAWVSLLRDAGAAVAPLRPSNCGFAVPWSAPFRDRFAGQPLKGMAFSFAGHTSRAEATVTRRGLEGGAIYALSAPLRQSLEAGGETVLHIDLKADMPVDVVAARLAGRRPKQSLATALRKTLGLAPVAIALLREAERVLATPLAAMDATALATLVGAVPIRLDAPMPVERAISTAGGVGFAACDRGLMLRSRAGVFVAGEMLDWEAPTGGYLLQACFATGAAAGHGALAWLRSGSAGPYRT